MVKMSPELVFFPFQMAVSWPRIGGDPNDLLTWWLWAHLVGGTVAPYLRNTNIFAKHQYQDWYHQIANCTVHHTWDRDFCLSRNIWHENVPGTSFRKKESVTSQPPKKTHISLTIPIQVPSMGMVYFPTFTLKINSWYNNGNHFLGTGKLYSLGNNDKHPRSW